MSCGGAVDFGEFYEDVCFVLCGGFGGGWAAVLDGGKRVSITRESWGREGELGADLLYSYKSFLPFTTVLLDLDRSL